MPTLHAPPVVRATRAETQATTFFTPLGWMAMVVCGDQLERLSFGHATRAKLIETLSIDSDAPVCPIDELPLWASDLCDRLVRFAEGEPDDFRDVPIATAHLTPFAKRVVAICRKIDWGQVLSYGEIAKRAGRPGAARAVGTVMAKNRVPLVVPCHRVVGSAGKLGGYSAAGGLATKRRLLDLESGV